MLSDDEIRRKNEERFLKLRNAIFVIAEKIEELEKRIDKLDERVMNVEGTKLTKELQQILKR